MILATSLSLIATGRSQYLNQIPGLSLGFGTTGTVTPTLPAPTLLDISLNTTPATGTIGNSWNASSGGALSANLIGARIYSSRSNVRSNAGFLQFGSEVSGVIGGLLGPLLGANVVMNMSADKQIATTGQLSSYATTNFAYTFDLAISTGLLGLNNLSVLNSLSLDIYSGATRIAGGSVFADILGLTSLTESSYTNVNYFFNYDPSSGPLSIQWSANVPVNAELFPLLFNSTGTNSIYSIGNTSLSFVTPTPIPEPSSLILSAAGVLFLLRRRHKI